tara:strand:- start:593 stop:832 length:240 start_codon:yes stop_codon:yes gene_type:complete
MTLPANIADREIQKFVEDKDGKPSLRVGPNAVSNSDGNTLDISDSGRALTHDSKVMDELKTINETLSNIHLQLEIITGT